jgi:hypothetical protein
MKVNYLLNLVNTNLVEITHYITYYGIIMNICIMK